MLKSQFNQAVKIAKENKCEPYVTWDNKEEKCVWSPGMDRLSGCGLEEFKPVETDLNEVAQFIRYQALAFNGVFDEQEIDNIWQIARRKFIIKDELSLTTEETQVILEALRMSFPNSYKGIRAKLRASVPIDPPDWRPLETMPEDLYH